MQFATERCEIAKIYYRIIFDLSMIFAQWTIQYEVLYMEYFV